MGDNSTAPGGAFAAGWNLLTNHPGEFFSAINPFSSDTSGISDTSVKEAVTSKSATTGYASNFGAGISELTSDPITFAGDTATLVTDNAKKALNPLLDIPTWAKVAIIGVLILGTLAATGYLVHGVKGLKDAV
jgi:hypothetical protein